MFGHSGVHTDESSRVFPEALDDYIAKDNSTRVIDVFVDGQDLATM